jgi:hypothetical protein
MSARAGRRGSTIWELLLGLAILLVLGLILVPAVVKVRELANRVECQNRLRKIAQALAAHHDQRGVFPGLGGYKDEPAYLELTRPDGPSGGSRLGLGSPLATPEDQPGSWLYQLLPFLDAAAARQLSTGQPTGADLGVKELLCPSRCRPAILATQPADPLFPEVRYSSVPPDQLTWGRTDYAANGRLLPGRGDPLVRFSNVKPGLANAILVGEKSLDTRGYLTGGWIQDGPALVGGPTCGRTSTRIQRDWADPDLDLVSPSVIGWGSPHAAGTHFVFASGDVRLIRHNLSEELLGRLLGPSNSLPNLD